MIGADLVTRRAIARMRSGAAIVNTASIWAVRRLCRLQTRADRTDQDLGQGLRPPGIRVCPGWVRTEASMRSLRAMAERSDRPKATLLEAIVGAQALPGLMEPVTSPAAICGSPRISPAMSPARASPSTAEKSPGEAAGREARPRHRGCGRHRQSRGRRARRRGGGGDRPRSRRAAGRRAREFCAATCATRPTSSPP